MGRLWVKRDTEESNTGAGLRMPAATHGHGTADDCVACRGGRSQCQPSHGRECRQAGSSDEEGPNNTTETKPAETTIPDTGRAVRHWEDGKQVSMINTIEKLPKPRRLSKIEFTRSGRGDVGWSARGSVDYSQGRIIQVQPVEHLIVIPSRRRLRAVGEFCRVGALE